MIRIRAIRFLIAALLLQAILKLVGNVARDKTIMRISELTDAMREELDAMRAEERRR